MSAVGAAKLESLLPHPNPPPNPEAGAVPPRVPKADRPEEPNADGPVLAKLLEEVMPPLGLAFSFLDCGSTVKGDLDDSCGDLVGWLAEMVEDEDPRALNGDFDPDKAANPEEAKALAEVWVCWLVECVPITEAVPLGDFALAMFANGDSLEAFAKPLVCGI